VEVIVRVCVPDRPGALATVAGVFAEAGADIEAVDVVESEDGLALDDLVIVVEPEALRDLVARIDALDDVELVHVGPSRGRPGDAVARLALGLESLLNGAMTTDHALLTLVGGLLRASSADLVSPADAPREGDKTLLLAVDDRVLVVRRDYRFTHTERSRAAAIVSACVEAASAAAGGDRRR